MRDLALRLLHDKSCVNYIKNHAITFFNTFVISGFLVMISTVAARFWQEIQISYAEGRYCWMFSSFRLENLLLLLHYSIANISHHFQNIFGYIPLKQAWAYQSHFFCKSFTFFETIKAANTGWHEAIKLYQHD